MTRAEFIARATRAAEKALYIPPGWWGIYRHVTGPAEAEGGLVHVKYMSGGGWRIVLEVGGALSTVSTHDSRPSAIAKARRVAAAKGGA